jgi:DNA (cytosine-5)-methyltransferase 1
MKSEFLDCPLTDSNIDIILMLKLKLKKATTKFRMIDLFTGTGAFTLAFESTGHVQVVWANDIEPNSQKAYQCNFPSQFVLGDINTIDVDTIPACDILTGGFSCQPFSVAGQQRGFEDQRSSVFWKIIDVMKHHRPRVVVLENVKNLVSHDKGRTFKIIQDTITQLGYHLHYRVVDTMAVTTLPQHRERIYLVCFRDDIDYQRFSFDKLHASPSRQGVSELLEINVDNKYYYGSHLKIWDTVKDSVSKEGVFYQYRRYYVRENKSGVCPTLTANMGGGGHNVPLIKDTKGIRKLTPRECFNLQGFPREYKLPSISDSGLYQLSGNAVSVPVVKLIAEQIVQIMLE